MEGHIFSTGGMLTHVCMLFLTSFRIMCYLQRKEMLLEEYLSKEDRGSSQKKIDDAFKEDLFAAYRGIGL